MVDELSTRAAAIVGLNAPCVPTAIIGIVSSIVVNALNCVSASWARTHISEEQNKIAPSLTDDNPAPSVIGVVWIVWIAASTKHSGPYVVFWNDVRLTMRSIFEALFSKAAAGARASGSQIGAGGLMRFSTITKTVPQLGFGYVSKSRQFPETLIGNVDKCGHPPAIPQQYIGVNW